MKRLIYLTAIWWMFVLYGAVLAQTSGTLWIKTFSLGSADLNDPQIDNQALAYLDSLMQDPSIEVTFLGAADSVSWKLDGRYVNAKISEAWNDAKRLSRARALRARYGRGNVGVTHEDIAGAKVIWAKDESYMTKLDQIEHENDKMKEELATIKNDLQSLNPEKSKNGHSKIGHGEVVIKKGIDVDWRLQAGVWTWQGGSNGNIFSPSVALNIKIEKTSFVVQGGVTPWHTSSPYGNQSESFVYAGAKYMKSDLLGFSLGGFRGWEFFTQTDNWSFKTTGVAAGVVLTYGRFEVNPTLTVSNITSLEKSAQWRVGSTLGLNFNIN